VLAVPSLTPYLNITLLLSTFVISQKRYVALQAHLVVQDAADLDDPPFDDPIHEEVAPASPVPGDMERAEARHDLVARLRAGQIGTARQLADCADERVPINPGLPLAEAFGCLLQDVCEIELCDSAETNAPPRAIMESSFTRA
jgi:hypothetical protein